MCVGEEAGSGVRGNWAEKKGDFGGLGRTLDGIGTGTFIICSKTVGVCSRKAEML